MTEPGRRERKKAATRQAIADAALRLFLERGYDRVSVREVADAADVSTTTLFKHFPSKESLVFDQDTEVEAALVATVRDRPPGMSIPAALREHVLAASRRKNDPASADFGRMMAMVDDTPPLREYFRRMWMQHEDALAAAIAEDAPEPEARALAHLALSARELRSEAAVEAAFALLERGWRGRDAV